ncbi:snaclec coagulation factor IX-binding protein subunit A-like [Excalfactoria chinensis]|uniref:snaclec coagulation factor IX-binding protein subunit A-like n=1 Tax=Excalfactoria chinensis TaxID=46218 RepID=UPI003B3AB398
MTHLFLFLLFGALALSGSEGAGNSTAKHRNARFLFNFFGGVKPQNNIIPKPPQEDSSAKKICVNLCQKGWISYRGHCYLLIQERMTWLEAERTCSAKIAGGHLTSITSAEQNEFLRKLSEGQQNTQFWTGGTYQKGSSLRWSDGSLITFVQRPLTSIFQAVGGLINNLLNLKLCLMVNIGGGAYWDSSPCSQRLPFICTYKQSLLRR